MAEENVNKVIVKARAMAFLTTAPEEEPVPVVRTPKKRYSNRSRQAAAKAAAEEAAAIKKNEAREMLKIQMVDKKEAVKNIEPESKKEETVVLNQQPIVRSGVVQKGKTNKIPDCKKSEPIKRPDDTTLVIAAKKKNADKLIQKPVLSEKSSKEKKTKESKDAIKASAKSKDEISKKTSSNKAQGFQQDIFIEFNGASYDEEQIVQKAEKIWTKELKKKAADMKSLELYIKPEENAVYYVFNKKESGSFAL